MTKMLQVAVIADDLTGAADTGIQFRPLFRPALLASHTNLAGNAFLSDTQVLAVNTSSRPLPAAGTTEGGQRDGLVLGTKPGAFCDDDVILRWREYWDTDTHRSE